MKVAGDAPSFLREDHPLMKFIALGSQFGGSGGSGRNPVAYVLGIDEDDPIDRTGVDKQTPGGGDESIGVTQYSAACRCSVVRRA